MRRALFFHTHSITARRRREIWPQIQKVRHRWTPLSTRTGMKTESETNGNRAVLVFFFLFIFFFLSTAALGKFICSLKSGAPIIYSPSFPAIVQIASLKVTAFQ